MSKEYQTYVLLVIIICSLITFLTRVLPFLIFRKKEMPSFVKRIASDLPQAIIAILVVYCLKGVTSFDINNIIFLGIGVVLVVASYIWKKNILISIGLGTIVYMVLIYLF